MRFLAALLLTALAASAQTNILKVSFADLGLEVRASRKIELRGVQTNLSAPYIISREYKSALTDTNGVCRFTNVVAGAYDLSLASTPPTIVRIGVTNSGTNVMEAYGLVNVASDGNAVQGYTQAAADARFYLRSNPSNYVTASITNGLGGGGSVSDPLTVTNATITTLNVATNNSTNLFVQGTNVMDLIGAGGGGSSGTVFVGMWTTNNAGFVPAVSGDGIRWDVAQGGSMTWSNGWNVANNSFIRLGANSYLMATFWGTNVSASATEDSFALWTSTNLLAWQFVGLHRPSITGISTLWAPELHNDNGTIYCYFSASTNSAASHAIYVVRALDTTWTNWAAPTMITNIGTNCIDAFVVVDSGTNYLFFKNETSKYIELAASTSPTNGFTLIKSNDWTGWGSVEAPTISRRPDGKWVAMIDEYLSGTYYNYSTSTSLLSGWTAKAVNIMPEQTLRHGTMRAIPFNEAAQIWADAKSGVNAPTEAGVTTATAAWGGVGQFRAVGTGGQAGVALYPTSSSNPWLFNGTSAFLTWWGPSGGVMQYNNSTRTLTITSNLTILGSVTAGSGLGGTSSTGVTNHQNAETSFHVVNTNTGASAYGMFAIQNGPASTDKGLMGVSGKGFNAAANAFLTNSFWVLSDTGLGGGMNIGSTASGSVLRLYAGNSSDVAGLAVIVTNKGGVVQSNWTVTATNTAGFFVGNGSGLTNLPASQLTGTVPNAALSGVSITNLDAIGTLESDPITVWPNGFQVTNTGSGLYAPITIGAEGESVIWVNTIQNGAGDSVPRVNLAHSIIEGFLTNQSTLFIGGGSGLANLNASQLTTGTVPAGRLTTAGTNLVGAVLTSDGVGNRYWTNAITGFSSVQATNLNMAGGTFNAGGGTITNISSLTATNITAVTSLRAAFSAYVGSSSTIGVSSGGTGDFAVGDDLGVGGDASIHGYLTISNGVVDIPRSSAPTFVQIGSRTNTPVMWWSNSAPCVRYVTYYNASSNAVTTNLFSLP